ncbi:AraC family transcriptional regulator [Halalkalibacter sp. MEB205]|uniref:AraC family transcriptional regulator n=2 Tax=Halalkalibacter alkaliphilus TaxID=2917993 RepID=A0A9X2I7T6_9BACI|nr:AraC family transcriptional regulator [Halalkalibacter alkaliphilus]
MYIKKGKMKIEYKDRQFIATANSFVFLDCYEPHVYQAEEETVFDWFHFSGNSSKEYFELLYEKNGCVYSLANNYLIPEYMNRILKMTERNEVDEHDVSIYIQKILYELNQISTVFDDSTEKKIEQAIHYIENHYKENIKLEDIANHVYLSPFYFTRTFKKYMNCSPVQYLINYRINNAKKLLHNTNLTVNEISNTCGFNSTSHFVTTFKNHVGMSPKKFRDIEF